MSQISDAALPALLALAIVLALGKPTIKWLSSLKMRQSINPDAPKSHMAKQGTPTMGGILFLFGTTFALGVLWLTNRLPQGRETYPLIAVYAVFAAHLGLGFLDDYLSAVRGKSLGLKARQKLLGQLAISIGFAIYLIVSAAPGVTTELTLWRGVTVSVSPYIYYPLVVLVLISMSNFTNLTDGLDGLAGGLAVFALTGLALTMIPAYGGALSLFAWSLIGAVLGFLCFNIKPAKVFMGDTGSLALGSSFAALAILGKQELALFVFGLVFVAEGVSVILQVISFKSTGRRIFRMAPLHHHFELLGWSERQVVYRFWLAGIIALGLGLLAARPLSPWRW